MELKIINSDNEILILKLKYYELDTFIKEDNKIGYYLKDENYKFFIKDKNNKVRDFIDVNYEIHVYIIFDEDNIRKLYEPSIEINNECIKVNNIKTYEFEF